MHLLLQTVSIASCVGVLRVTLWGAPDADEEKS
jgi:hypothetical protein